jgi:hypothetical protein
MSDTVDIKRTLSDTFEIGPTKDTAAGVRQLIFRNGSYGSVLKVDNIGTFDLNSMVPGFTCLRVCDSIESSGMRLVADIDAAISTYIQPVDSDLGLISASGAPAFIISNDHDNVMVGGIDVGTGAQSSYLAFGGTDRGFLPPRLTSVQRNSISDPATGLMVFDTDMNKTVQFNGITWQEI